MKTLAKIIEKYSAIECNSSNYYIGGGLAADKFASRRHEDAKQDEGKVTFGKAAQMFKKATGVEIDVVYDVFNYQVPSPEWHHAGKLPKSYGGGMKKTYFLNANEIVDIAKIFHEIMSKLELRNAEKRQAEDQKKTREQTQKEFLNANATYISRIISRPSFFHETEKEYNGKYGWFSAYGKSYNITAYYSGYQFATEELLKEFNKI